MGPDAILQAVLLAPLVIVQCSPVFHSSVNNLDFLFRSNQLSSWNQIFSERMHNQSLL